MHRLACHLCLILSLSAACKEEREPHTFPTLDVVDSTIETDASDDSVLDEDDGSCNDHTDCSDDELCFHRECIDREEALSNCNDDHDCPDGFICVESDYCEEE